MKKIYLAVSIIGMISLTSCGAQENCREKTNNYKISKQQPSQMLAAIDNNKLK